MDAEANWPDLAVVRNGQVTTVEIRRPPNNFFDKELIRQLGEAFERADLDDGVRALVLAAEGKNFCAGADFQNRPETAGPGERGKHLYKEATRLFRTRKPIIAGVQGAAVGGGLGLAMMADFRVACAESRFVANFARLGFHQGFGLSVTLPRAIGAQRAALMFYTGRRIPGDEAVAWGMADLLVPLAEIRSAAQALAAEIAASSPLAVQSMRETLRRGLAEAVETVTERELVEQDWQRRTDDFREGVRAMSERRQPQFRGH